MSDEGLRKRGSMYSSVFREAILGMEQGTVILGREYNVQERSKHIEQLHIVPSNLNDATTLLIDRLLESMDEEQRFAWHEWQMQHSTSEVLRLRPGLGLSPTRDERLERLREAARAWSIETELDGRTHREKTLYAALLALFPEIGQSS